MLRIAGLKLLGGMGGRSAPLLSTSSRHFSKKAKINLPKLRSSRNSELEKLPEVVQRAKFIDGLEKLNPALVDVENVQRRYIESGMPESVLRTSVTAAVSTFLLHVEARVASALGVGFYTIGPCGEELLAAVGGALAQSDASALHYRHVATALSRQLASPDKTLDGLMLDRARSYTCSTADPVTGGKHCAIGGLPTDFLVTSTLASQASPAVGRALGVSLSHHLAALSSPELTASPSTAVSFAPTFPPDAVSYCSLGDGSVNNGHFLSALNLAEYAQHRGFKVGETPCNTCTSACTD